MKKLRIIFLTLIILWMGTVFYFSNQPGDTSKATSSSVTKFISKIIYNEKDEEYELKVEKLDRIVRKLAHFSIYTVRRNTSYKLKFYI